MRRRLILVLRASHSCIDDSHRIQRTVMRYDGRFRILEEKELFHVFRGFRNFGAGSKKDDIVALIDAH